MGNQGIAKRDQEFLGQVLRFINLDVIDNELKQKFIEKPHKINLSALLTEAYGTKTDEKFSLILELKVTIPMNYKHEGYLDECYKNKDSFYFYNNDINDKNFGQVSHKLIPGKTYLVKIWLINKGAVAKSEEILALLRSNQAYLTGAHGSAILWDQKRNELPKGKWYVSFDEENNLWKDADGRHRVPGIERDSDGDYRFFLGYFENDWDGYYCVIGFCDC